MRTRPCDVHESLEHGSRGRRQRQSRSARKGDEPVGADDYVVEKRNPNDHADLAQPSRQRTSAREGVGSPVMSMGQRKAQMSGRVQSDVSHRATVRRLATVDGEVAHHRATVKAAGHADSVREKLKEMRAVARSVRAPGS